MRVAIATALTLTLILTLPMMAPAAALNQLPKTGSEAMAQYEGDLDNWIDGPAEYLILDDERDEWKELTTSEQRAAFITRFWDRRDADLRTQGNPFKDAFYARVAYANERYRDTPFRGWRSDRGRLAVTLGLPDAERPIRAGTGLVWTYFTFGAHAEGKGFSSATGRVEIAFESRGSGRNNYMIAGSLGAGVYPAYVLHALDFSRRAAVGGLIRPVS